MSLSVTVGDGEDMGVSCGAANISVSALCPCRSCYPLVCWMYLLTVTISPLPSDVHVLPGGDPADGYDDAREVSDPGEDVVPVQGAWEVPRSPEEGAEPRDAPRGERET